jgi:sulfur-oxidizing protein SoxB
MNLSTREFLQVLGAGAVAGLGLGQHAEAEAAAASAGERFYDLPRFGKVSLLHMTDCHAQLKPIHFREPGVNLGVGSMRGQLPHLVGRHLLKATGVRAGTREAHALSNLSFEQAARRYGKVGGFAHLATLSSV